MKTPGGSWLQWLWLKELGDMRIAMDTFSLTQLAATKTLDFYVLYVFLLELAQSLFMRWQMRSCFAFW